jgi:glycosyltransferase involved in cell wall biosynthesis
MTDIPVKMSFAITTHNEGEYIQSLLNQLIPFCAESGDEIVVVDDFSTDELTLSILNTYDVLGDIKLVNHALAGDFAAHKNFLTTQCSGDYIFQIDADEVLHKNLLKYVGDIVDNNDSVDLFWVPRVNIVTGMVEHDIQQFGWNVNELGWVQWPDYQTRIYRNSERIQWVGKVHERISGHKTEAYLPAEEEWAIYHIKNISRQRRQNEFYETFR